MSRTALCLAWFQFSLNVEERALISATITTFLYTCYGCYSVSWAFFLGRFGEMCPLANFVSLKFFFLPVMFGDQRRGNVFTRRRINLCAKERTARCENNGVGIEEDVNKICWTC